MLTAWKREPELAYLGEVSSVPLQQGLRHLQTAAATTCTSCPPDSSARTKRS